MPKLLNMIVAVDGVGNIGQGNKLPWPALKGDMRNFKACTSGGRVLMGRNTWESLPPSVRPLPGRKNVVLTSTQLAIDPAIAEKLKAAPVTTDVTVVQDLMQAFALADDGIPTWVIGGATLYREAITRGLIGKAVITDIFETYDDADVKLGTHSDILESLRKAGGTWKRQDSVEYPGEDVRYNISTWVRS